jgi:hypothetical protein
MGLPVARAFFAHLLHIPIDFFPNKSHSGDPGRWDASSLI